ncbi:MAG: type II toxin-antitoxin system HicA family toxin [Chthoniobacteraceae bacterium]
MPKPIKRRELVRRFRTLGWQGPEPGHRHMAMRHGAHTVPIPNPHGGDLDWTLVKRILVQAGITPEQWEQAGRE